VRELPTEELEERELEREEDAEFPAKAVKAGEPEWMEGLELPTEEPADGIE
jgi:hypothetical protein